MRKQRIQGRKEKIVQRRKQPLRLNRELIESLSVKGDLQKRVMARRTMKALLRSVEVKQVLKDLETKANNGIISRGAALVIANQMYNMYVEILREMLIRDDVARARVERNLSRNPKNLADLTGKKLLPGGHIIYLDPETSTKTEIIFVGERARVTTTKIKRKW